MSRHENGFKETTSQWNNHLKNIVLFSYFEKEIQTNSFDLHNFFLLFSFGYFSYRYVKRNRHFSYTIKKYLRLIHCQYNTIEWDFFSDFHKSHACSTHISTNRHHVMLIDIIVNERNEMKWKTKKKTHRRNKF